MVLRLVCHQRRLEKMKEDLEKRLEKTTEEEKVEKRKRASEGARRIYHNRSEEKRAPDTVKVVAKGKERWVEKQATDTAEEKRRKLDRRNELHTIRRDKEKGGAGLTAQVSRADSYTGREVRAPSRW
jgi:hypothetical protein